MTAPPGSTSKPFISTRFGGVLLGLLVLFFLATFIISIDLIWEARQWSRAWIAGPGPKDSEEKAKRLEEKLTAYNKRADDLHTLVAYILGLSSLYSIALGVSSYLGVQHALNQAKEAADDVRDLKAKAEGAFKDLNDRLQEAKDGAMTQADAAVKEIRSQYLLIGRVDRAIDRVIQDLNRLLPLFDDSELVFARLTEENKQQFFFYEKAVASLELFDLKHSAQQASEIFDRLGRYYGLKYVLDRKGTPSNPNRDDLERSRFYLDRAIEKDGANILALNDRAFLAIEGDSPSDLAAAREVLERSLATDGDQQRARYNLALVEHKELHYLEAEQLLTKALSLARWEREALLKRTVDMRYNRACARCRLYASPPGPQDKFLKGAFEDIKSVFDNRVFWNESEMKQDFQNDCEKDGDLQPLLQSPTYSQDFKDLLSGLSIPWS
jgi:hypothetical protein